MRGEADTKWRRRIGRCGVVHDVVCRGSSAWPCRGIGLRASARRGSARLGAMQRGVPCRAAPWCCRLTYLSAAAPPATGSAASVQSGVLPICIPDSPPDQSNDSPVYPFSLDRASLCLFHPRRSHTFLSPRTPLLSRFLSPEAAINVDAKAAEGCSFWHRAADQRDDILAVGYRPSRDDLYTLYSIFSAL